MSGTEGDSLCIAFLGIFFVASFNLLINSMMVHCTLQALAKSDILDYFRFQTVHLKQILKEAAVSNDVAI